MRENRRYTIYDTEGRSRAETGRGPAALGPIRSKSAVCAIYRYASRRVIKVAAQINQNWYTYQKYRYIPKIPAGIWDRHRNGRVTDVTDVTDASHMPPLATSHHTST